MTWSEASASMKISCFGFFHVINMHQVAASVIGAFGQPPAAVPTKVKKAAESVEQCQLQVQRQQFNVNYRFTAMKKTR